jgi:hypothetical protein
MILLQTCLVVVGATVVVVVSDGVVLEALCNQKSRIEASKLCELTVSVISLFQYSRRLSTSVADALSGVIIASDAKILPRSILTMCVV